MFLLPSFRQTRPTGRPSPRPSGLDQWTWRESRKSLASFERTLLSGNSPFDKYRYGGDKQALSPAAVHGLAIFEDPRRGNCVVCHSYRYATYALFTDGKFHNTGAGVNGEGEFTDMGRFGPTKVATEKGEFKTPTSARRRPYPTLHARRQPEDIALSRRFLRRGWQFQP